MIISFQDLSSLGFDVRQPLKYPLDQNFKGDIADRLMIGILLRSSPFPLPPVLPVFRELSSAQGLMRGYVPDSLSL